MAVEAKTRNDLDIPVSDVPRYAELALAKIAATPKCEVHASRKGVVAGASFREGVMRSDVLFRRVDGKVRLEVWRYLRGTLHGIARRALTPEVERRAGVMLDQL